MINKNGLNILYKLVGITLSSLILSSCGGSIMVVDESGKNMIDSAGVYTLVNLHPDVARSRLYAVNYQLPYLMPLCTEVTFLKASSKTLRFKVNDSGQVFSYKYHRAAVEPFDSHLSHFFGRKCNTAKVKTLSEIDQKGIRLGIAIEGMTREGVVFAMGIPPRHKTPDLKAKNWRYWKTRAATMIVQFDNNGQVSGIIK